MAGVEDKVAAHYGRGGLIERIRAGLAAAGADLDNPSPEALKPVDEFHIGGVKATDELLGQIEIPAGAAALDIGCGLGGTARLIAARTGAAVTGVDLTPEYVETARALSAMAGVGGVSFHVGSALALPVPDAAFDLATLLHVGMNIEDKARLMTEARRALKPGGTFAVYEVMRGPDASDLVHPLPWAETPDFSFVAPLAAYEDAARAAGFEVVASRGRRDFALAFFEKMRAATAASGPPPLGIHLLMGDTAPQKIANMIQNIAANRIEPTELILRAS